MRLLLTSFYFYKRFFYISMVVNLLLLGMNFEIPVIVVFKLFTAVLLWGWYRTEGRKQLVFYQSFGCNSTRLLLFSLLYDLLLFTGIAFLFRVLL